jgi:quercetin dioxygenase-like cupin family protein
MNSGMPSFLLQTSVDSLGHPLVYPREGTPEITAFVVEMEPGRSLGWHHHPVTLFGYILAGELTVYQKSGEKRVVRAGEASLESIGLIHLGINEGTAPLKMLVVVIGVKDLPFTVFVEEPK